MGNYNTIIKNDVANGEGVCVSFWVQGCPHKCNGCFNPETWSFTGGQPYTERTKWEIIEAISDNGIQRNFSILGGEPLADRNFEMTKDILRAVRTAYPHIKIFLWTGYSFKDISQNEDYFEILKYVDVLIDGKFIKSLKHLGLKWRGSTNQKIWTKDKDGFWSENDG